VKTEDRNVLKLLYNRDYGTDRKQG